MAAFSEGATEAINKMASELQDDWLRDQFALAAMRMFSMDGEGCKLLITQTEFPQHREVAKFCWDAADAMMRERDKRYSAEEKDWNSCQHKWREKFDSDLGGDRTEVVCKRCDCPGERNDKTGNVVWPTT